MLMGGPASVTAQALQDLMEENPTMLAPQPKEIPAFTTPFRPPQTMLKPPSHPPIQQQQQQPPIQHQPPFQPLITPAFAAQQPFLPPPPKPSQTFGDLLPQPEPEEPKINLGRNVLFHAGVALVTVFLVTFLASLLIYPQWMHGENDPEDWGPRAAKSAGFALGVGLLFALVSWLISGSVMAATEKADNFIGVFVDKSFSKYLKPSYA